MYLRIQASAGLPQSLFAVFFSAPVPSGCTLAGLESRETTVIRLFVICSFRELEKSVPGHRFLPTG
jgi:hypothetical protein